MKPKEIALISAASLATATLVGKHLGERNPEESLKTGFTAASIGIFWGLFMGIIFMLFPEPIIRIYTEAKSQAEADSLAQKMIEEIKALVA
jgi:Na+-driven multidrug efflux pump